MDLMFKVQQLLAYYEFKSLDFVILKYSLTIRNLPSAEYLTAFWFVSIGGGML